MYVSSAFIAGESGSIFTPSFGFSMHQLIMSRSVANWPICSWNFGNSCGWLSDPNGWHIAHAMPVRESWTFSFFAVASSPWKSRSPIRTCSMNTSSNALSCWGVCLSLWARAELTIRSELTRTPAAMRPIRIVFMAVSSRGGGSLVRAVVGPFLVRDAGVEVLVHVVRAPRIDGRLREGVLPPHHVLVLDLARGVHRQPRIADAVEEVAGVRADHAFGERRDALGRVGPRPGGGEHADGTQLANLVVEHLVRVAVDVGDVRVRPHHLVDLPPVTHPEVPWRVVVVEGIVAEDHDWLVLGPAGQRLVQPQELVAADAGPGPGHAAVQGGHVPHALLRAHLLRRPVVRATADGVEPDEADALVIERPVGLAEEARPLLPQVQVPIVLSGDEDLPDLHLLQDLVPEIQLDGIAELGEVTAVDQEVRGRLHGLDLFHGPDRLVHEAGVDLFRVEVVIGDPGELERRRLSSRLTDEEIERADEREPPVGGHARGTGQHRLVEERAARDLERSAGSLALALQRLLQLTPLSLDLVHDLPLLGASDGPELGRALTSSSARSFAASLPWASPSPAPRSRPCTPASPRGCTSPAARLGWERCHPSWSPRSTGARPRRPTRASSRGCRTRPASSPAS